MLSESSREIVEFYIACGIAGVIGVAINVHSTSREIRNIMTDCGARGFISGGDVADRCTGDVVPATVTARWLVGGESPGWSDLTEALHESSPARPTPRTVPTIPR